MPRILGALSIAFFSLSTGVFADVQFSDVNSEGLAHIQTKFELSSTNPGYLGEEISGALNLSIDNSHFPATFSSKLSSLAVTNYTSPSHGGSFDIGNCHLSSEDEIQNSGGAVYSAPIVHRQNLKQQDDSDKPSYKVIGVTFQAICNHVEDLNPRSTLRIDHAIVDFTLMSTPEKDESGNLSGTILLYSGSKQKIHDRLGFDEGTQFGGDIEIRVNDPSKLMQ